MKPTSLTAGVLSAIAAALLIVFLVPTAKPADAPNSQETQREKLHKLASDGNYKDAYDGFRKLALDPKDDPVAVGSDLDMALQALQQLGRLDEIDELRENVAQIHAKNWRLLSAVAESYLHYDHYGFIVAGKFSRGPHRGEGDAVNSMERDRVRALQLMVQAIPLSEKESQKSEVANFWMSVSKMLMADRGYGEAWRLQYLTDLAQLPDYEKGWYRDNGAGGAPVDTEGNPVFHHLPKSWAAAQTDGERWRWALAQVPENDPSRLNEVRYQFADFLQNQFGVQTMGYFARIFSGASDEEAKKDESGIWALDSLADDETIARLAGGIKRFKLPEEFDFIAIYRKIADEPKTGHGEDAFQQLAQIYENRRQYDQAADYWRRSIKEFGPGDHDNKKHRVDEIVGNWGRFEPVTSQAAGQGATVDFRFRNGRKVSFEAHEIKVAKLLDDVKAYLKSNPQKLDWQKINIADIGYRLVQENQTQYVGERIAQWSLDLEPRKSTSTSASQSRLRYKRQAIRAHGIWLWLRGLPVRAHPHHIRQEGV